MDFNKNWIIEDDFGNKKTIDLPYDAMIYESRDKLNVSGKDNAYFPGKKYTFTKTFNIDSLDYYYEILFEACYQKATVYLNDKKIHYIANGYTEFIVCLNDHLVIGENKLVVVADNRLTPNCRWYTGAGLYREVHFIKKKVNDIKNVKVETIDYQKGLINVDVDSINNPLIKIYYNEELVYQGDKGLININNPKLWNEDTPNLYKIEAITSEDKYIDYFGIRSISITHNNGLLVNGKKVLLKGACLHSDNGLLGMCSYYDAEYNKVKALKEAGFNAIRCAHNPCSRHFLNVCDKLGMYVIDELYDCWYTPKTYYDQARFFSKENYTKDIQSMVNKDYNHPCVIMYSIGNEISELTYKKGLETCNDLNRTIKMFDKTRFVTCGVNLLICVYGKLGFGVYKDNNGYEEVPLTVKKVKKQKNSGSTFFNMLTQRLGKIMFLMSRGKIAEKIALESFNNLDILGLNYGSSRYEKDAIKYKDRIMFGSETLAADLAYNWSMVEKYNCIIGDFVWVGVDYLGEAGFGDWTYYSYKGLPITSGSGVLDLTLNETAEVKYMQVIYNKIKKPVIALRPLNHAKEVPYKSAWRFTDAIVSYNFNDYDNTKAEIEVYAYAKYVKLLINNKEVGFKKLKHYRTIFKTKYHAGEIKAISYDENKKELGSTILYSGDNKAKLAVKVSKNELLTNKNDLSYIDIYFVDSNNNLLPCVEQPVDVSLEGPIKLLSFGSALCTTDESYFDNTHTSYRGHLLLIVKATENIGEAKITISSNNVLNKEVNLTIKGE